MVTAMIFALITAVSSWSPVLAIEEEADWKTIRRSAWVQVDVEKVFYKKLHSDAFFIHVRVKNDSRQTVVISLNNRFSVFYPNQWAESNGPRRGVVDEERMNQADIVPWEKFKLEFDLPGSTRIAAGKTFDYFISFNRGSWTSIQQSKLPYIIMVMDGHLTLTDGKTVELIKRDQNDLNGTEVPFKAPVRWATVPASAKVFD
jgi:hypothetical protein